MTVNELDFNPGHSRPNRGGAILFPSSVDPLSALATRWAPDEKNRVDFSPLQSDSGKSPVASAPEFSFQRPVKLVH